MCRAKIHGVSHVVKIQISRKVNLTQLIRVVKLQTKATFGNPDERAAGAFFRPRLEMCAESNALRELNRFRTSFHICPHLMM